MYNVANPTEIGRQYIAYSAIEVFFGTTWKAAW